MAPYRDIMWGGTYLPGDLYLFAFVPTGVHAVCDRRGWRVAGGAGPHVLQCETGRQVSAGKELVLLGRCSLLVEKIVRSPV